MIALLNETQAEFVKYIFIFAAFVIAVIIAVIAVETNHQERLKKIRRQQAFEILQKKKELRTKKEDEALGQYIIDQAEEYHRDFDDAS